MYSIIIVARVYILIITVFSLFEICEKQPPPRHAPVRGVYLFFIIFQKIPNIYIYITQQHQAKIKIRIKLYLVSI